MKKVAVVRGCTGCDTCRYLCKVEAITFDYAGAHIDPQKCVGCGICEDNCASSAIVMKNIEI
jgi:ferredoxin